MSDKEIGRILLRLKALEAENEKLKEENAYLRFELDDLRSKRYKSGRKNPPDDTAAPGGAPTKKRGGLFGHVGWFRNKPKQITRIEKVRIDKCPECGSSDLTECGICISISKRTTSCRRLR